MFYYTCVFITGLKYIYLLIIATTVSELRSLTNQPINQLANKPTSQPKSDCHIDTPPTLHQMYLSFRLVRVLQSGFTMRSQLYRFLPL